MSEMNNNDLCLHCGESLDFTLVDLGASPLCNELLDTDQLHQAEQFFPLHAKVCQACFLVQVGQFVTPDDIFTEYSYFSSYSETFVEHARVYVEEAISDLGLSQASQVMEVASNDGYLLQHFLPHNIPVLGIEPAQNVAEAARQKGIPTISEFLGSETATKIVGEHGHADLVAANNVVAHTPFLNDFVKGLAILLKPNGVVSVEFAHVLDMLEDGLYDTIYHEHFCYHSLYAIERVMASQGLQVFDAQKLSTHGGSLRVWSCLQTEPRVETERLIELRNTEAAYGISRIDTYATYRDKVEHSKRELLKVLIQHRENGKKVVGYGVPGKGNTLLNYCGIRTDLLDYMVDLNPYKQGKFTPGTRIPILDPDQIKLTKPDYVLIMPWNIVDEIVSQISYIREWGGQFIVALPTVRTFQ